MSITWKSRGRAHILGDDVVHDGGVIPFRFITSRITDPQEIIASLFDEIDPTLRQRLGQGDFIVAGKNFLAGKAHNNGLIGLKALGIRILCASMSYRAYRGATSLPLPVLTQCEEANKFIHDGDEIEVDFATGAVADLTTGEKRNYPPMAPDVRVMIEAGGMRGLLAKFLQEHPALAVAADPFSGNRVGDEGMIARG